MIDRAENRHLAFGVGIHRCAGSNLARMELRVALEEWMAAIPEFELEDPGAVTWAGGQVRGALIGARHISRTQQRGAPLMSDDLMADTETTGTRRTLGRLARSVVRPRTATPQRLGRTADDGRGHRVARCGRFHR